MKSLALDLHTEFKLCLRRTSIMQVYFLYYNYKMFIYVNVFVYIYLVFVYIYICYRVIIVK